MVLQSCDAWLIFKQLKNENAIDMGGEGGGSGTHPDKLNNSAELRLLLVGSQSLSGWFNPRSTQSSHHPQKVAPIWRLNVKRHTLADGQGNNMWDPALQCGLDNRDLRFIKSERFKGERVSCDDNSPQILQLQGEGQTYKHRKIIFDQ